MPNTVVKMPQLGESVSEGTIGRWLKQPGERVERDEPLVEIQTDKVNAEVPSPVAGILQQILLPEGTTAAVKTDMAIIGDEQVTAAGSPAAGSPAGSAAPVSLAPAPPSPPAAPSPAPPTFTYDKAGGGGVVGQRDDEPSPAPAANGESQLAANGVKRFYTPVVLRMAEEHALDLNQIQGSGAHGRVTRRDVERAIAEGLASPTPPPPPAAPRDAAPSSPTARPPTAPSQSPPPGSLPSTAPSQSPPAVPRDATPSSPTTPPPTAPSQSPPAGSLPSTAPSQSPPAVPRDATPSSPTTPPPTAPSQSPPTGSLPATSAVPESASAALSGAAEDRPLSPMRRAIAEHMTRARAEIPDAWSLTEIDVTNLVRQRQTMQAEWQAREGYELTYLPFFVKAVLAGLRAVPELNATFAGDHITLHREYNLGIAVSLDNGLVVPVLRAADQLSVAGIARALRTIIQKARSGKLAIDDLQGATFTVNNPGSLGSIMSQPIVPVGQAGIVTMEAIVKRPVVTADDAIAIRSMMNSCLSFDHRVLDGAGALKFLRTIKTQLETVELPLY